LIGQGVKNLPELSILQDCWQVNRGKEYLMPILPLDHLEPFAATLGVMLYPGTDEDDRRKARAFAAHWLAEPFRRFDEAGHKLSYDALARVFMDAGVPLTDLGSRWSGGLATGDLFKTLFILAKDYPALASWEHAIRIYETSAKRAGSRASRTNLWRERSRFQWAAHLWGAWSIREGKFGGHPEVGYDGWADFQFFLAEAEILRDFGQNWRRSRARAEPPLPPDVWCVPPSWEPPSRQPGWPNTGMIPDLTLPDDLMAGLKPPGRPRKLG
jgi:hypothetical protein